MEKRKWKWLTGCAALIIMVSLALSTVLAQEKEKKRSWNPFKKKTEEVVEAEEEALPEGAVEEEEPADWSWEDAPMEAAPRPAGPVAAPPPSQKVYKLHQVGEGENLHLLAAYYYGDARAWPRIYQLNKKQIRNPNVIRVGQILKVEVPPGWKPRFELAEFKAKEVKRKAAIEQAKIEKPTIIKETQTVIPTIAPLVELEEEEAPAPGAGARPPLPVPTQLPPGVDSSVEIE